MDEKTDVQTLALFLCALAIIQNTGSTHVNYEIMATLEKLKRELDL